MKWIIVLGIAVALVLIASVGRIPFTERKLATSEETRAAAAVANTPKYTRSQAISMVEEHIRENCRSADKYLARSSNGGQLAARNLDGRLLREGRPGMDRGRPAHRGVLADV